MFKSRERIRRLKVCMVTSLVTDLHGLLQDVPQCARWRYCWCCSLQSHDPTHVEKGLKAAHFRRMGR